MKPKIRSHILFQPSSDGCLLLDEKQEQICSLNRTAAFIWTFCDGNHTEAEIEAALAQHWKGNSVDTVREVKKTLEKFRALNLLEL